MNDERPIIICSPQLGLNPNSILGGEVFDREILLGLAQRGIEIEIILPKGKAYDRIIKNWNITTVPIKHFPAILANLIFIPYLFKVYAERPFGIIRLHSPRYLGIAALVFKFFKSEVKLIATYHQFRESNFLFLSKIINNHWDHIICDSQNVKDKLCRTYKILSRKITVVHNGAPSYLRPAQKDHKLLKKLNLENKIVLLFMGLFIERKNPLFLIDVLSKLSQLRSDIVLILWGDGPLRSQIVQKAKESGVEDKIRIIDPIFGSEKNKIHNLADIFVHPSLDEGFALAPLESMACAKPVVITGGYSSAEAVEDDRNGFICRLNDSEHWSNQLLKLISDSKLRQKMGQASFDKVKKEFRWQFAINAHYQVFKDLIK